jgi:hypothetical protein
MADETELTEGERELGELVKRLIAAYAVEQIQDTPLKAAQVDELFSSHVAEAMKWRAETLDIHEGPLTLMDCMLYSLFQILGGYVAANVVLAEASELLSGHEAVNFALRMSSRDFAQKAAARMELLLD